MTTGHTIYLDAERGIIVTVETALQMPLAMGNYDLVVSTRTMRHTPTQAPPTFDLDKMCSDATLRLLRRIDAECEHLSDCVTREFTKAFARNAVLHSQWQMEVRAWAPKPARVRLLSFVNGPSYACGGIVKPYDPPQGLVGEFVTTGGMR